MKSKKQLKIIIGIFFSIALAINLIIIVNAFIPGDESAQTSYWVADLLASIINAIKAQTINNTNMSEFTYLIRKLVGHFSLFLVDGVFMSLTFYYYSLFEEKHRWWLYLLLTFGGGLFVAALSEFIQLFIPGRVGSIIDVLIDMSGYLIAMLIIFIIFIIKHRSIMTKKRAV